MTLHWHSEAQIEFEEAAIYYEEQVEGLGERFVTRIEAAAARVLTNPLMPRCFDGECRKVKTDKFPYLIIYRVKNEELQILAIAHTSRRPGYWKERAKRWTQ